MNYSSIEMMETLVNLEKTINNPTDEQTTIIGELKKQIHTNGRFYEVLSITVELMREHGYDVTEDDAGYLSKIAEKVEIDGDILWGAIELWADHYGVKRIYEEFEPHPLKKAIVGRFIRLILPKGAVAEYLSEVYENEMWYINDLDAILSSAYWWHSGGEEKRYHVDAMGIGDGTDDVYCVIYEKTEGEDEQIGNLTLTLDEAIAAGLEKAEE